jgi:hypothetical protein
MRLFVILSLFAIGALDVYAQTTPAQKLGTCLTDNTTGRERKDLARWIFTAIAAHPEMDSLSAVTPERREQVSQTVGALYTRLFADVCRDEVRAAAAAGGDSVIGDGFGILGEVAMQELMLHDQVEQAMFGVAAHLDMERIEAAMQDPPD